MPKIVLAKAAQVPLKGPIRWPGYTAEVDDATFDALSARGVLEVAPEPEPDPEPDDPSEPEPDPEPDDPSEPEPDPEADAPDEVDEAPEGVERPKKVANLDTWQSYARSLGIDPKGMTKAEIIAATE